MRICIFGAGAIGGHIGAKLAKAGADVTFIARGPHLAAMRENGLVYRSREAGKEEEFVVRPPCTDDAAAAGPHDYVLLTTKANGLASIARQIQPLLHEGTAIVSAVNGVPWWYFHGLEGREGRVVESVDPGGEVSRLLPPSRAIGCIVYPAAEVVAPGVVEHSYGDKYPLGEPDGAVTPRVEALSAAMTAAGLKAPATPAIREEIWIKLWGNLCFNPISALTGGTLERICVDPETRELSRRMMTEGEAIARAHGITFKGITIERRINGAQRVGAHKTSMLQDLERGRPMEIDALLGSVVELGRLEGIPTPTCEAVLALVRQKARLLGLYA